MTCTLEPLKYLGYTSAFKSQTEEEQCIHMLKDSGYCGHNFPVGNFCSSTVLFNEVKYNEGLVVF